MKQLKIMVVDDEFASLALLKKHMSKYGECDGFEASKDALIAFHLAHAKRQPYDLITLDINMPYMDGNELLEAIRNWELASGKANRNDEVKIIMVTAAEDLKSRMRSLRKGCEEYLVKPVRADAVDAIIKKLEII
ncbi:MAG: response regulator [SAR324 cluster bacterium]|nr:response regulator [SAR324 cluster bacterium]